MGTVHVALARPQKSKSAAIVQAPMPARKSAILTTPGDTTAADLVAEVGEVWLVTAVDVDVLFASGPEVGDLNAADGPSHYCVQGVPTAIGANDGDVFELAEA
jgi:hypothetical protein